MLRRRPYAVVAIPARDEADRIEACLAALATQRDSDGAPMPADAFEIVVFANNCTDRTAVVAATFARSSPVRVAVIAEALPPDEAHAGGARRRAMNLAAARLADMRQEGVIMTSDADSLVASTWVAATLRAFEEGADGVAGYVDPHPLEMMRLGPEFVARGRLEETYHRLLAEIDARCDPRPHDPWPNHRVAAGASLAVTSRAYKAIGGLLALAVGEDAALVEALERGGFRVRHAMDVVVSTSCRLDGRVPDGAAATMRHRRSNPDAPCDKEFEPALSALRRALLRGRVRRLVERLPDGGHARASGFGLSPSECTAFAASRGGTFPDVWAAVSGASPRLRHGEPLRPSELPGQIRRAEMIVRSLRNAGPQDKLNRLSSMASAR